MAVEPVVWRQARERSDVLLATEIPVVPVTGEGNADGPRIPLILEDAVGNKWAGLYREYVLQVTSDGQRNTS